MKARFTHSLLGIGSAACLLSYVSSARAAVLSDPVVILSAPLHSAPYVAINLFDGRTSEYASLGQGTSTFVEMDFGTAVTMSGFVLATRRNHNDVVGESRLILSNDPNFAIPVGTFTFPVTGQNGDGLLHSFASTTAQYARWEVVTSLGVSQNLGALEMVFLNISGTILPGPAVVAGTAAFNAQYAQGNATNEHFGTATGVISGQDYASAYGADSTTLTFDFGGVVPITGFDWFDRLGGPAADQTTAFMLEFSNDSEFGTVIDTKNYIPGVASWGYGDSFDPLDAQYVRYTATAGSGNTGISEILFYTVPEPSAALLGALAGAAAPPPQVNPLAVRNI